MKWLTVAWLAAGLSVAGGQAGAPKTPPKLTVRVGMGFQSWLYIFADGSGTVGYGAGDPSTGYFKAGTFDVDRVVKQLKALPVDEKGTPRTHYDFSLESERKGPEEPGPAHYTTDRKLIPALFEQAYRASDSEWPNVFQRPARPRDGPRRGERPADKSRLPDEPNS